MGLSVFDRKELCLLNSEGSLKLAVPIDALSTELLFFCYFIDYMNENREPLCLLSSISLSLSLEENQLLSSADLRVLVAILIRRI
jgi:hypothetical protein